MYDAAAAAAAAKAAARPAKPKAAKGGDVAGGGGEAGAGGEAGGSGRRPRQAAGAGRKKAAVEEAKGQRKLSAFFQKP